MHHILKMSRSGPRHRRDGAVRRTRFAEQTLPQAEFTSAEEAKSFGAPGRPAGWGTRDIILAGCLINYYAQ